MLIILVKVIFEKNRFLYPKNGFFEKIDPKGRPKYSSRDRGTKIFLWDIKVQDEILPWTKNGGGSVTMGRVIAYANLTRKFKNYRESYE